MSIRAGVVVSVPFQKVDAAPNAETRAQRDHQRLKYVDCTIEKCHSVSSCFLFWCLVNRKRAPFLTLAAASTIRLAVLVQPDDVIEVIGREILCQRSAVQP